MIPASVNIVDCLYIYKYIYIYIYIYISVIVWVVFLIHNYLLISYAAHLLQGVIAFRRN